MSTDTSKMGGGGLGGKDNFSSPKWLNYDIIRVSFSYITLLDLFVFLNSKSYPSMCFYIHFLSKYIYFALLIIINFKISNLWHLKKSTKEGMKNCAFWKIRVGLICSQRINSSLSISDYHRVSLVLKFPVINR